LARRFTITCGNKIKLGFLKKKLKCELKIYKSIK